MVPYSFNYMNSQGYCGGGGTAGDGESCGGGGRWL